MKSTLLSSTWEMECHELRARRKQCSHLFPKEKEGAGFPPWPLVLLVNSLHLVCWVGTRHAPYGDPAPRALLPPFSDWLLLVSSSCRLAVLVYCTSAPETCVSKATCFFILSLSGAVVLHLSFLRLVLRLDLQFPTGAVPAAPSGCTGPSQWLPMNS